METLYLLDTNILIHLIRDDETGQLIREKYSLLTVEPRPIISVVTEGELRSFSYQRSWGEKKKDQMSFLLGYFWKFSIDKEEVLEAYAEIDSYSEKGGHSMDKNDVWIAATANVIQAKLLTTDRDFSHLQPYFFEIDLIEL